MTEIARLNKDAAKTSPETVFDRPQRIVEEMLLTRGEKIATLERWRINIFRQLDAASEGMRTRGTSADQAETLREIDAALRVLAEGGSATST